MTNKEYVEFMNSQYAKSLAAPIGRPDDSDPRYRQTRPELAEQGVVYDASGTQVGVRVADKRNAPRILGRLFGAFARGSTLGGDDDFVHGTGED